MMKADNPRCPASLSVLAVTTAISAYPPLVMKILLPLMMYSSPFFTAVVFWLTTSDPAPDSVRSRQPSLSPEARGTRYFFFCSSEPNRKMGSHASEVWAERVTPVLPHTLEISSTAST